MKGELQSFDNSKEKRDIYDIISKVYGINKKDAYIKALIIDCMRYRLILASKQTEKKTGREGLFLSDLGKEFLSYIFEPKEGTFNGIKEE